MFSCRSVSRARSSQAFAILSKISLSSALISWAKRTQSLAYSRYVLASFISVSSAPFHLGLLSPSARGKTSKNGTLFCTLSETLPTVLGEQIAGRRLYTEILGGLRMASADEYLVYVEHCIVLALKAPNPGDKARLLQMAQAWRDLADKRVQNQNKSIGEDQFVKSRA